MSIYQFAPSPDIACREENITTWENGFSEKQLEDIVSIGEELVKMESTVSSGNGEGKTIEQIRKSEVSWISLNNRTEFIYNSMAYIARQLNGQFFNYDLYGFVEDFQYTVYRPEGDHYTWHIDKGRFNTAPRKLSMVLQLSDPSEYDGGDLEFFLTPTPTTAKKEKGLVYVFPSYVLHRVTPVTRGTRRTLVIWISGPKFR